MYTGCIRDVYILTLSCHYFTRTSPTKMGYNITFFKSSRRKEGGGGKEKIFFFKNIFPQKYFWKNFFWENIFPKNIFGLRQKSCYYPTWYGWASMHLVTPP